MKLRIRSVLACALLAACPVLAAEPTAVELNNQAIQEAREGRLDEAVQLMRRAHARDPNDAQIRSNLSLALADQGAELQRRGKQAEALPVLVEATGLNPENGVAWARIGDLHYLERNDFSAAIEAWKKAAAHLPGAQRRNVVERIAQAERDKGIERSFLTHQTDHFQVRYPARAQRSAAVQVGERLEKEYEALARELDVAPAGFTVILYGSGDFGRLSLRPDWAVGFYDGRIRVRVEDVAAGRDRWILPHELAHAFLQQGFGGRLPTWVHEGYAQTREPVSEDPRAREMAERVRSGALWVPLDWLDSHFEQPSGAEDIERSYVQAWLVADYLIRKHGIDRFRAFVRDLASGAPVPQAFDRAFAPASWSRVSKGNLD